MTDMHCQLLFVTVGLLGNRMLLTFPELIINRVLVTNTDSETEQESEATEQDAAGSGVCS